MPAKRSRRGELIAAAVIVLVIALCVGGYYLSQAIYKANEPQLFEDSTRSVNAGEPMTITYREIGKECNYVKWYGDMELTVQSAVLYDSYPEAREAEGDLGKTNSLFHDGSKPFLVVRLDATNIDAVEHDLWWNNDKDAAPENGVVLNMHGFDICTSTPFGGNAERLVWCTWLANGQTSGAYEKAEIDLLQGETAHVVLGFSLEDGEEDRLADAFLVCTSIFDRFYLKPLLSKGGD